MIMGKEGGLKSLKVTFLFFLFSFLAISVLAETPVLLATPESGKAPLTVSFSIQSNDTIDSYAWDFNEDDQMDSNEQSPAYTYTQAGTYFAKANLIIGTEAGTEAAFLTKKITVLSPITATLVAVPQGGKAPLNVQFTVAATGKEPLTYLWDFNGDGAADSTQQNPSFTFNLPREYNVTLAINDGDQNTIKKTIPVTVTQYDSHLNLSSYFPTALAEGENQVEFIITNQGTEPIRDITAKIVGAGFQHLTSTNLAVLNPSDQDSISVKVKILQTGNLTATVKIIDKTFPITFAVAQQGQYSKEEFQQQFDELKTKFQEQLDIYQEKKAAGYQVSETFESIKNIQKETQATQEKILIGKYAEAKVSLDLLSASITDLTRDLGNVKQVEVSIMAWLKDNALAITAVAAALGALSGFLIKLKSGAKKAAEQAMQFGEHVKKKIPLGKKGEAKAATSILPAEEKEKKEEIKKD